MENYRTDIAVIVKRLVAAGAVLVAVSALTACSIGSAGHEEHLKVIYECYSDDEATFSFDDEDSIATREHLFVVENVSDKGIGGAKLHIDALDDNGNVLKSRIGGSYPLPYLMPGEKAIVSCMDAEWTDVPASYRTEIREDLFVTGSGVPLTLTSASNTAPYAWNITVKNDGDEAVIWSNGYSDEDNAAERSPALFAVVKNDGDEATVYEGHMIKDDALVKEDISIAPGEEYTAEFSFSTQFDDPEFIICWRI